MADAFIQVATDGTGKKMQTYENTVGASSVHAEAVVLVDQFGAPLVVAAGIISVRVANGASFDIPEFNEQDFTYVNSGSSDDDLIATQIFKLVGVTVATLTYSYVGSTNNISSITQS